MQLSGRPSVWTFTARIPRYTSISAARTIWLKPHHQLFRQVRQMMKISRGPRAPQLRNDTGFCYTQVASVKAVREALDKVSLPAMLHDVPGGVEKARVKAKIGVPKHVGPSPDDMCTLLVIPSRRAPEEALPRHSALICNSCTTFDLYKASNTSNWSLDIMIQDLQGTHTDALLAG